MKISEFEKREKPTKTIWTEDEIDTLKRYYPKVKAKELQPYLRDKSLIQIYQKAVNLGLTSKKVRS